MSLEEIEVTQANGKYYRLFPRPDVEDEKGTHLVGTPGGEQPEPEPSALAQRPEHTSPKARIHRALSRPAVHRP